MPPCDALCTPRGTAPRGAARPSRQAGDWQAAAADFEQQRKREAARRPDGLEGIHFSSFDAAGLAAPSDGGASGDGCSVVSAEEHLACGSGSGGACAGEEPGRRQRRHLTAAPQAGLAGLLAGLPDLRRAVLDAGGGQDDARRSASSDRRKARHSAAAGPQLVSTVEEDEEEGERSREADAR
jgi:hypothetical protein